MKHEVIEDTTRARLTTCVELGRKQCEKDELHQTTSAAETGVEDTMTCLHVCTYHPINYATSYIGRSNKVRLFNWSSSYFKTDN